MDASLRKKGVYAFGRFRLDTVRRTFARDGEPISLTPRLFDTLLYLVENADRVVEKDELLAAVWPSRFVEERNISQAVFIIRKMLSEAGEENRLIETVPGRGYRLAAPVHLESESSATDPAADASSAGTEPASIGEEEKTSDGSAASEAGAARRGLWPVALAATAMVLITGGVAVWWWDRFSPSGPVQPNTVVLADFQNLTPDRTFGMVLDKVLEIDLAQSPFLMLLPPQRIGETLKLMERPADARLTPVLAQEVCARYAGKAVLDGSVGTAGSRYIVTLQARDCISGDSLARAKAETGRKEDVPDILDGLSVQMRKGLDESLASIHKFDVPIAQATTSSFEALKDFSLGDQLRAKGDFVGSLPFFKHAIELDPSFALAYEAIGDDYHGLREILLTTQYYQKAFDLGAHTSANEKLRITTNYYQRSGNFTDALQSYQLWTQTYPRDWLAWTDLANFYTSIARYPEAIAAGREALRLNPQNNASYVVLARAYKRANRFAESEATCRQAVARGYDNWDIHGLLYEVAFVLGDRATMAEQVAKEVGKPTESWMILSEADVAGAEGRLRLARELFEKSLTAARLQGPDGRGEIVEFMADYVEDVAELGTLAEALKISRRETGDDVSAMTLAEAGDYAGAEASLATLRKKTSGSSSFTDTFVPIVQARIDLRQNKPQEALTALQPALPYAMRGLWAPTLLAQAYLQLKQPDRAADEFRRIIASRGLDGGSELYPLAWLGLARALHMQGKLGESRAAYERLFAFWKNADSDLPILRTARREYAELVSMSLNAKQASH